MYRAEWQGPDGQSATLDAGIPAIIYEAGGVLVLQPDEIERGVTGVRNIMSFMGMLPAESHEAPKATVYKKTRWLRVPPGAAGMFLTRHKPGNAVKQGDVLGEVVDPFSDKTSQIIASDDGLIIGMEVPNIVYTGDALFHLGLEKMQQ
jgi:predicted deacylase